MCKEAWGREKIKVAMEKDIFAYDVEGFVITMIYEEDWLVIVHSCNCVLHWRSSMFPITRAGERAHT